MLFPREMQVVVANVSMTRGTSRWGNNGFWLEQRAIYGVDVSIIP